MKKVCVLGLGYIGLPTASLVATKGYQVHGVDVNPQTVDIINQGKIHIHEPDLDILVKSAVGSGHLKVSTKPEPADIFIIAVPTPFLSNYKPDLSFVKIAAENLIPVVKKGDLIILESTSPVGTTEKIREWIISSRKDLSMGSVHFAHCPERVLPGQVLKELILNDRIIGGLDAESSQMAKDFYQSFVTGQIFITDARTAEMAKLAENSFRDVNIAFANELSIICDRLNIDVWKLIELANRHPRVKILNPGPGVGGHCIAVDPWFIVDSAPEDARLIRTAREVNDRKPKVVIEKVLRAHAKSPSPIACLGLSFKANVDDLRSSPALEIAVALAEKGIPLVAVEPHISALPLDLQKYKNVQLAPMKVAMELCDTLLLLVDHREFINIDPSILARKKVVDTRGIWK